MKSICALLFISTFLAPCFGMTESASVLTIGTVGPDAYADGKPVMDGECYALVWRASGRDFAGFKADGNVVEPDYARVLCLAPLASGGKCPETTFVVDGAVLAACGSGGSFGLYLLDSRRWDSSGRVSVGGAGCVQGSMLVSETTSVDGFLVGKASGMTAFLESALPADRRGGSPTITNIRVEAEDIVLTVEGTAAALNYNVAGGETTAADDVAAAAAHPVTGADQPVELRVPRAKFGGRAFFKVVRNPMEVK